MKLPKTLLGAIMVGIALNTVTSCTKDKDIPNSKILKEKEQKEKPCPPAPCPACGMG